MSKGGAPVARLSRRILAAAFVSLLITAIAAIFFVVLTRLISEDLAAAQGVSGAEAPLALLADALVWGQGTAIAALTVLTAGLFALAWYLRERLLAPLESLRRSLATVSAGALGQPISGLERKDEIGAAARAAERLRQAAVGDREDQGLPGLKQLIDRLSRDAGRLEADLAVLSSVTIHARVSIEEASVRAAKASHTAIEAANLVRDGAERITEQAEEKIAALANWPAGAARSATFDEVGGGLATRFASDAETSAVLASLAGDLEALERFAHDRRTIAGESAAALTVALVEAIDRLNGVADRISATADLAAKHKAA